MTGVPVGDRAVDGAGEGLVVEGLSAGYGRTEILHGVDLGPLRPGEFTVLVGPNAAGKSTLLRALAGLIRSTGSIRLDGEELVGLPPGRRAERTAFMPQTLPGRVDLSLLEAVLSALMVAPGAHGTSAEARDRAFFALDRLGLSHRALEPLGRLSGGQRQLVSLAQVIVREPRLILLDEPTSALDLRYQVIVMRMLRSLAAEGRVVVAVLHDLTLGARWADRIVLLNEGEITASAAPDEALTVERLEAVYGVESRLERCSRGSLQVIVDDARSRG